MERESNARGRRQLQSRAGVWACWFALGALSWLIATASARARAPDPPPAAVSRQLNEGQVRQLEEELDGLVATQQKILDRFDEILQEIDIVKVRAMRRRAP